MISRGYFDQHTQVVSLRDFFEAPKGKDDIRKVYNGTSSGLWLPTVETSLRLLKTASYCGDMDLGEMFLNFPMDTHIRSYAVVDLCSIQDLLPASLSNPRVRWNWLFMGMLPSAYHAVEQFNLAEKVARGSPHDLTSPCGFDVVWFNIPGSQDYSPTLPWVMKWNTRTNGIAGDFVAYMDDIRFVGSTAENAWQVGRRLASGLQYMGIQDAPRKRRPPSMTPGAWAGSVQHILETDVSKTITQAKWDKGKTILETYQRAFSENSIPSLDHKQMQRDIGFLVHLAMMFSCAMPFLEDTTKKDGSCLLENGSWNYKKNWTLEK